MAFDTNTLVRSILHGADLDSNAAQESNFSEEKSTFGSRNQVKLSDGIVSLIRRGGAKIDKEDSFFHSPVPVKQTGLNFDGPFSDESRQRIRSVIIAKQEWEGHVQSVDGDRFNAILYDLTDRSAADAELGEFDIEEVSPGDKLLVAEGAVFNWIIGYETTPAGQKKSVSYLVFRRLPAFRQKDIEFSKAKLQPLFDFLNADE